MEINKSLFKKVFVSALVAALVLSALLAIWSFLAGSFNDVSWKILLTTVLIGIFSLIGLSTLLNLGSEKLYNRLLALVILTISFATLIFYLLFVWSVIDYSEDVLKSLLFLTVLSIGLAHIGLIFSMFKNNSFTKSSAIATIVFISFVMIQLTQLIFIQDMFTQDNDFFFRLLGVNVVLDVLGTILTPIIYFVTRPKQVQA